LPELVSYVEEGEAEIVVTRNGKPAAVLVNYDEYERSKETLNVLSDPGSMRQIAQSIRVRRYRIVYALDHKTHVIRIFAIGHRREVYVEKMAARRDKLLRKSTSPHRPSDTVAARFHRRLCA